MSEPTGAPGQARTGPDLSDSPDLSIIVVTWNIRDVVQECLESLYAGDLGISFETILVDNGSEDGTVQMLAEQFPQVIVLPQSENLGFTRANNIGMRQARGRHYLLLNSDTVIIDHAFFPEWIRYMDANPGVAASGVHLVYRNGVHQTGDAGFRPALGSAFNYTFFLSRLFPRRFKGIYVGDGITEPFDVDWVCGANFLVRREVVEELGGLSEELMIYAEDVEWGCRMRDRGFRVVYLPQWKIVHLQGATTGSYPDKFSAMPLVNLRRIYGLFNPGRSLLPYDLLMVVAFALRTGLYAGMCLMSREHVPRMKRMLTYFRHSVGLIGSAT